MNMSWRNRWVSKTILAGTDRPFSLVGQHRLLRCKMLNFAIACLTITLVYFKFIAAVCVRNGRKNLIN